MLSAETKGHTRRRVTLAEFQAELRAQGVAGHEDFAFRCPRCRTVQSSRDLVAAGAGKDFDAVESLLGYSCVGRYTGAPSARREPDGKPCDWSLGGLLRLHEFEVETEDGEVHPRFEPATPEEAQAHARRHAGGGQEAAHG